jgi:hypothetical protein
MRAHTIFLFETSGLESLFFTLSIFHEHFLLTPGFFPENEEIFTPPLYDWSI